MYDDVSLSPHVVLWIDFRALTYYSDIPAIKTLSCVCPLLDFHIRRCNQNCL